MQGGKKQNRHEMEKVINPLFNVQEVKKMGMIINPYRFGGAGLLLDAYTGATCAYSLRKLRTEYNGYCIEVRRSSDNTTQNIGFTAEGVLDESALTTFCGAGNGFVKTWYDQVGSLNITQGTAINQPRLVSSGSVVKDNNKPCVDFYAGNFSDMLLKADYGSDISQAVTFFSVNKYDHHTVNIDNVSLLFANYNDVKMYFGVGYDTDVYIINAGSSVTGATSNNEGNQNLYCGLFNGSSSKLWCNNVEKVSGNVGSNAFRPICVGNLSYYSGYAAGKVQEIIIFPSDKTSDKSGIQTNINSFYSIY
jgi:hypothetical protein